jgi:ribosomal protein S18 acetylase RimI-like enzyme
MVDIEIATADRSHVDGISALLSQVQRKHFLQYPGRFRNPNDVDLMSTVQTYLEDPKRRVLVASAGNHVVGYLVLAFDDAMSQNLNELPPTTTVEQIAVDEAHQGRKIGSALLAAAEDATKAAGIAHLELDVWSFNEQAENAFVKFGFTCYNKRMWKNLM